MLGAAIFFGLWISNTYSYLIFHSLAEVFCIVVAFGIFILAWSSKEFTKNYYLFFIGIAYLFVGALDLLHTLSYKGMGVFVGYDANLPTQLWIAARYLQSLSLFAAPLLMKRKLKLNIIFFGYAAVFSILLLSIFHWRVFPDCFIEGAGLTPFKKISEFIISLILVAAIAILWKRRSEFEGNVLWLIITSIILTICAELVFTFYVSVYDFSNLIGHYLKIISFYLIYKAIIETGLLKPVELLFRDLKKSENSLREAKENLELQVKLRTTELTQANEALRVEFAEHMLADKKLREKEKQYRDLVDNSLVGVFNTQYSNGEFIFANNALARMYDYENSEQLIAEGVTACWSDPKQRDLMLAELKEHGSVTNLEAKLITPVGRSIHVLFSAKLHDNIISGMVMDITERKKAEKELNRYQERLKALASQLIIAQEKERSRIAADLHDHIGQNLAFSRIQIAQAKKYAPEGKPASILDEISQSLFSTIQDTKRLIFDLSPPLLHDIGLTAAISNWLEDQVGRKNGIMIEFIYRDQELSLNNDMKSILFRNVRELLSNVIKHAQATKVVVSLVTNEEKLAIIVRDDGIGFDHDSKAVLVGVDSGFGLFSVKQQIEDFGGKLEIVSKPGKGCKAILTVPINN